MELGLLIGCRDEQQFVARIEWVVGRGCDDPRSANDGDERSVGGPALVADPLADDRGIGREGDLHEIGIALAKGEQPDEISNAHRLLNERREHPGCRNCDVDPP